MASGTSTPLEAGQGPSVLGIAASIGAKIRDAAEDAKEQREKAAEKGETPKKGSLFKSALSNQFNPIKSKKAKSKWAQQFDWNKKTNSDQQVKPPAPGGGGGDAKGKLKEFIAGGFTAILQDTAGMVSRLDGVKALTGENLAEVTRASSTLTVIKDSIDAQTELRRKALEEAKFARAEKQLEKTTDNAGVSDFKDPEKKDEEGGGDGGGGGFGWLDGLLGGLDAIESIMQIKNLLGGGAAAAEGAGAAGVAAEGAGAAGAGTVAATGAAVVGTGLAASYAGEATRSWGDTWRDMSNKERKEVLKNPGIAAYMSMTLPGIGSALATAAGMGIIPDQLLDATEDPVARYLNYMSAGAETIGAPFRAVFEFAKAGGDMSKSNVAMSNIDANLRESYRKAIEGTSGTQGSWGTLGLYNRSGQIDKHSEGGVVDNPTKTMLNPGDAVIPLNRNSGKDILGNKKQTSPEDTALDTVGAMILGVSAGMLGKTDSGTVGDQVKQDIRKASKEFGISNLTFTSSIGQGQFGKVDPKKSADNFMKTIFKSFTISTNSSKSSGGNNNPPPGDPTGPISAAPKGNETDIQSLQGSAGAPIDLSQNTDVATGTGLHHGNEDMRNGLRVRDYFIGGKSGSSDGSDGLGAKLYTPLGFGPLIYKSRGPYGIDFLDPTTKEKVGTYLHVDNAQHQQWEGKSVPPGTVVGTQGGLPGTPSALGSSSSVHLHVEGTDAFHRAVIRTYADGNIMKQQVGQSDRGNVAATQQPTVTRVAESGMMSPSLGSITPMGSYIGYANGGTGGKEASMRAHQARLRAQRASAQRSRLGVQKVNGRWVNMGVSDKAVTKPWWQTFTDYWGMTDENTDKQRKAKQEALARSLAQRLNRQEGNLKPSRPSPARGPSSGPSSRPAPSTSPSTAAVISVPPAAAVPSSAAVGSFGSEITDGKTKAMVFADFLYVDLV